MSTAAPQFRTESIGRWSEPEEFCVTKDATVAYAQATNDDIPAHASGELAPPVFAVVPVFAAMGRTALQVIPAELIGMILHGEQDFRFNRPIVPGMTLLNRAAVVGLHTRSSGVTVVIRLESTDKASGDLVCEQDNVVFVRGADAGGSVGKAAPAHGFPEELRAQAPVAEVTQVFDEDQTYRYSAASGDPMPIHLDADFAKAMGLPGIIIHGLCTMAFASRAVIQTACPQDPARLKRLAVRFSKPVLPGESITTRIWSHALAGAGADDLAGYAFETTSQDGATVLKDGRAEIAT